MDLDRSEADAFLSALSRRLDRRAFLGAAGSVSLAAFLMACGAGQTNQTNQGASSGPVTWAKGPVKFVYINSGDPNSLDPAITTLFNAYDVVRNVYDPLVQVDETKQQLIPWLARSFESSSDGTTHTFHLRRGVTFHDGSKLDAASVQLNMQRYMAIGGVGNGYLIDDIADVSVVDPMTVKITTKSPDSWLPAHLTKFPMVSADAVMKNRTASDPWAKTFFNKNMVGTGAYKFDSWQPGVQIVLNKNEQWWKGGWQPGSIDQVIIKPVTEAATRVELIQSGEADFCTQWTISDAVTAGQQSGFTLQKYHTPDTDPVIFMNAAKPPLDNQLVRQAFQSAFDYDAVAKYFQGYSTGMGGPFPPFYAAADKSLPNFKRDLNKARSLLKQANVDPSSITIQYLAATGYPDLLMAGAVSQSSLQDLGIKVNVQQMPYGQILAAYSNPATAGMMTAIYNSPYTLDPTMFLAEFLPTYVHYNYYNVPMQDVVSLVSQIRAETDAGKRQTLLDNVQKAIREHAPVIFGATPQTLIPIRNYIHGYVMQETDFRYPTLFYQLRIAQH